MILADLHTHTKVSHGVATVEEMYAAARAAGLEYLGISEHSPLPPGFSCRLYQEHFAEDFPALCDEVLALARREGSPRLLLGIELDWIPSNRLFISAISCPILRFSACNRFWALPVMSSISNR